MRILTATSRLAFAASHAVARQRSGFGIGDVLPQCATGTTTSRMMSGFYFPMKNVPNVIGSRSRTSTTTTTTNPVSTAFSATRLFLSSNSNDNDGNNNMPQLQHIGFEEMEEIVDDYENGGRDDSGYVIMDVREVSEIANTGKVSPNTLTLPLQRLMQVDGFALDEDDFLEIFGFDKPSYDETLVFTCAAGVRSVTAAQLAGLNGYGKLVNYRGGAYEWFRSSSF